MQKNIWGMVAFVIIAVAVIWAGVWYGGTMSANNQTAMSGTSQPQSATSTTVTTGGTSATFTTTSTATSTTSSLTTTTMDGLQIKDLVVGTGTVAEDGDSLSMLYTGS